MTEKQLAVREEPTIAQLLGSVIEKGITADNVSALEKLCELKLKVDAKSAEREFNVAFAKLQQEMPNVTATKAVPNRDGSTRYCYAPFQEIMDAVQPKLTENGFSVSFNTRAEADRITAICTLRHISGHSQTNEFTVRIGQGPPQSTPTQADGAAKTYAKRGALSDALNIVVEQDDDARIIGGTITQEQADQLRQRVRECGANEQAFLAYAGAAHYEAIPENRYEALDAMLKSKEAKAGTKEKRNAQGEIEW